MGGICECPECGRRGSLQRMEKKGNTYWYVTHGASEKNDRCWLGREYYEIEVFDQDGKKVKKIGEKDYEKYKREED